MTSYHTYEGYLETFNTKVLGQKLMTPCTLAFHTETTNQMHAIHTSNLPMHLVFLCINSQDRSRPSDARLMRLFKFQPIIALGFGCPIKSYIHSTRKKANAKDVLWGRVSKSATNGSKATIMDVTGSLVSSAVQSHDSLDNRRACACSEAGFSSKMATVLKTCTIEEQRCAFFCGQKDSMQRIFIKKCFLFTVGSVCRVKRFTTGWQMFLWWWRG
jgi:hypothetical protein